MSQIISHGKSELLLGLSWCHLVSWTKFGYWRGPAKRRITKGRGKGELNYNSTKRAKEEGEFKFINSDKTKVEFLQKKLIQ